MLTINCLFSQKDNSISEYLKKVDSKQVINYKDIVNKLMKNDIYSIEPSEMIINSHLVKHIKKTIVKYDTIYYVFSTLEPHIIHNLKQYIKKIHEEEFIMKGFFKDKDNYSNIHFMFDSVDEM